MGILNMFSGGTKTVSVPVEAIITPSPLSPAVSSISSCGSGNFLIQGQLPKPGHKRKAVSLTIGRKRTSTRLANIIWSGLFLMVIIATIIVVVALAENIRRTLFNRVSLKDDDSFQPITGFLDDAMAKTQPDDSRSCLYQRVIWERGSKSSEIIHDLGSKWSALIDHDEQHCLVFNLPNTKIEGCPYNYPWDLDVQIGVPGCRGLLARIAPIRKIMHHVNSTPVNLTVTGETIASACVYYKIFNVDKVTIEYYDRNLRRVARNANNPPADKPNNLAKLHAPSGKTSTNMSNEDASTSSDTTNEANPGASISNANLNIPIAETNEAINTFPRDQSKINVNALQNNSSNEPIMTLQIPIIDNNPPEFDKSSDNEVKITIKKSKKLNLMFILFARNQTNKVEDKATLEANQQNEEGGEEEEKDVVFWEAVYQPVGQTVNRIFRAPATKDLQDINEWIAKVQAYARVHPDMGTLDVFA